MIARDKAQGAFADAEKDTPAGLLQVLLSNHWPGRSERATLRRLAIFLNDRKSLDQFIALLIEPVTADDTGLEALEGLFPGELNAIVESIGRDAQNAKANKTLRKGQTKEAYSLNFRHHRSHRSRFGFGYFSALHSAARA